MGLDANAGAEVRSGLPEGFAPRMVSFDVYGTLVDTPRTNGAVFRGILAEAGRPDIDALAFAEAWERRNIAQYGAPYRTYKEICRRSLGEAFAQFGVTGGRDSAIGRYFDAFASMTLYADVEAVLERLARRYRLAVVSNIDDDLLAATRLGRTFDLVCTAERAGGYKPDGTLFRFLMSGSGLGAGEILHCGQSQFTDMVGAKPLGLTVAWINRRGLALHPSVPRPDVVLPGLSPLVGLVEGAVGAADGGD